jgi:hypothetical protein
MRRAAHYQFDLKVLTELMKMQICDVKAKEVECGGEMPLQYFTVSKKRV